MKDYMNKMPKETLTVQNIRYDLKKDYKKNFWLAVMFIAFSVLMLILALGFGKDYNIKDLSYYFVWIATIAVLLCTVWFLVWYIKALVQLKQKITIVTDWLVDIREDVDLQHGMYHRNRQYTVLTFAKYGQFRVYTDIYGDINYTWSKMYAMSNKGVCNYSNIDDEFYLVISNDKNPRILKIYNQKLFELR